MRGPPGFSERSDSDPLLPVPPEPPPRPEGAEPTPINMGCCLVFGYCAIGFMTVYLAGHVLCAWLHHATGS